MQCKTNVLHHEITACANMALPLQSSCTYYIQGAAYIQIQYGMLPERLHAYGTGLPNYKYLSVSAIGPDTV